MQLNDGAKYRQWRAESGGVHIDGNRNAKQMGEKKKRTNQRRTKTKTKAKAQVTFVRQVG